MNTLNQEQQLLIEQYLCRQLTKEQQVRFEELLANDLSFAESVFLEDMVVSALSDVSLDERLQSVATNTQYQDFCELLLDIDDNFAMQQKIEAMLENGATVAPHASSFSSHEAQSFRVVEEYAKVVAATERSDGASIADIVVQLPPNGIRCKNYQLLFRIQPTTVALKLRVENNRKQTILRMDIEVGTTEFVVQLPQDQCSDGRYYWKLYDKESMIIREFFIWENK